MADRTARQEAVEAMVDVPPSDEALSIEECCSKLLDALSPELLARLAVESGGMEPVGWRWQELLFGSWVTHHWEPDDDLPKFPVYAVVVPSPGVAADPQDREVKP